ncbi:lipopolysaccharide biosynthesis protein [Thermophagus sp. OGC60D27]|uniref:lipopolysaccharide biosynthesis protein n=1 Tax=Thermophagus sp. OGC60D27 TaxID=3458415 RepID=UPI0040383C29
MQNQTRFIFRQGVIYGIGNVLVKLSGVILIPLYLRYINEEEFGIVALFETIFQFSLILSGFGARGGFMRWYHEMKSRRDKKQLFYTTVMFNLMTTTLTVGAVGAVVFMYSQEIFQYHISSSILFFFLAGTFFRLMMEMPYYLLKIEQKAVAQTWWVFLNMVLLIGTTFYFMEVKRMGLRGIYLGQMVAHSLTFLALLPMMVKHSVPKFNVGVLKEMLHYGFPLAVSNILTTVLTLSDRHIINQYQNLSEVAGYSMGFKVSNLLQMVIVSSFITGYSNYYFKTLHEKGSLSFYEKILRYFVVFISFGGLGVVLFSPEIIYVVSMGREFFQSSVVIVPVLMIGMLFSGLRQMFMLPLNKHKRTRRISLILVLSAVINIGGNFLLVPVLGKMGASVSTVAAQLFAVVWFYVEVRKTEPVRFSLGRNFLLLVIWGALAFGGMPFFDYYLPLAWAIKVLLLLLFILSLFLTGHIRKEEIGEVKNIYHKIKGR